MKHPEKTPVDRASHGSGIRNGPAGRGSDRQKIDREATPGEAKPVPDPAVRGGKGAGQPDPAPPKPPETAAREKEETLGGSRAGGAKP
jgi:hypothetical protein